MCLLTSHYGIGEELAFGHLILFSPWIMENQSVTNNGNISPTMSNGPTPSATISGLASHPGIRLVPRMQAGINDMPVC